MGSKRLSLFPALAGIFLILFAGCASAPREDEQLSPEPNVPDANSPNAPPQGAATQVRHPKDGVFEIDRSDGCTIRFTTHINQKTDDVGIDVRDSCRFSGGLPRSLPLYGELLDAVVARHSKSRLKRFASTSWKAASGWDQELAVAAMESGLWKTFTQKRKATKKILSPNHVFVGVFNEGNIHRKLAEVFEQRGLTLRLKWVEKVFEKSFKNLSFAHEYAAYSASKTKVPYTAGAFYFEIGLAP